MKKSFESIEIQVNFKKSSKKLFTKIRMSLQRTLFKIKLIFSNENIDAFFLL